MITNILTFVQCKTEISQSRTYSTQPLTGWNRRRRRRCV